MGPIYLYAIISVLIVSLVSLVGVFTLSIKTEHIKKYLFLFVSLAVGALLGDAFIHLIPEAFEEIGKSTEVALAVIGGILLFFILEKILHWHHHLEDKDIEHHGVQPVGKMILLSDGLHNLIDGLIIGASYLVSVPVGIATTVAVLLHEIPQEIGDFGVLLHAGYSKARALWLNFLSALLAVAGVIIALLLGDKIEPIILWFLPVAAGGFIYIAMSDLIPELHKHVKSKITFLQLTGVLIGIGAMIALLALE